VPGALTGVAGALTTVAGLATGGLVVLFIVMLPAYLHPCSLPRLHTRVRGPTHADQPPAVPPGAGSLRRIEGAPRD
jgi:hypothetical protein